MPACKWSHSMIRSSDDVLVCTSYSVAILKANVEKRAPTGGAANVPSPGNLFQVATLTLVGGLAILADADAE